MVGLERMTAAKQATVTNRHSKTPSLEVILQVAADLFQANGFKNVSMQDVATTLAITKPTLYAHASTKTKILEGIFETVMREGEKALQEATEQPRPEEQLRVLIERWTHTATTHQAFHQVFAAHMPDLPRASARYYMRWSAEVVDRVRQMVIAGQRSGAFRSDMDPTVTAFSVVAIPNWTARWYDPKGRLGVDDVVAEQWRFIRGGLVG
jgi:TetR/AcrR family transcriptional regulator, cholesterol catabolism regulator